MVDAGNSAQAGMAKKEAEKMQRLLQREVGEGVDLTKVRKR